MDSTINTALESIAIRGAAGILLADLWQTLTAITAATKRAAFSSLISLPCLRFSIDGSKSSSIDRDALARKSVEQWEIQKLRIVAEESLIDSVLGIDDLKATFDMSDIQRRVLERVAAARTSGITQSDLGKEFDIKGNNFFYIVKNLESQQLIVRQSTLVKEMDRDEEERNRQKNMHICSTNMLYLYRYAPNTGDLNCQQQIQITRLPWGNLSEDTIADKSSFHGDVAPAEGVREDVYIKDYLPAMRAVCNKLEEASEKIYIVKDLKKELGYEPQTKGHRAWRSISKRLIDAGLVEPVIVKFNNKDKPCLRLLKKFDPNDFQPKPASSGYDGIESETLEKHVKRGQITDQHLEIPMEQRIYDMIDAEGVNGTTVQEVCKRVGLNSKKLYKRIITMCLKFGMRMESEMSDKTKAYRVWTKGHFEQYSRNSSVLDRSKLPTKSLELVPSGGSSQNIPLLDSWSHDDGHPEKTHNKAGVQKPSQHYKLTTDVDAQQQVLEFADDGKGAKVSSSVGMAKPDTVLPEKNLPASSIKQAQSCHQLVSTKEAIQREQMIIARLQDEKFILTCELFRCLNDVHDKYKQMDRRTLKRTLNKLQEEGLCKISQVTVPVARDYNRTREEGLILHPSVDNITPDILDEIRKRLKHFADESYSRGSYKAVNKPLVAGLTLPDSSLNRQKTKALLYEMRCANGYVPAKMMRVKLLHYFLWGYLSNLPDWHKTLQINEHDNNEEKDSCTFQFAMKEAIKEMPLQLFLQIVGTSKEVDDLLQKCKAGLRLSQLSDVEYKKLVNDTLGTARLSALVKILLGLKLIKIAGEGLMERGDVQPCVVATHAMELRPYIEEPMPKALDLRPRLRHDFFFKNQEAVDEYWETLEYCYAGANKETSKHAFPGSAVDEVFLSGSWSTTRVLTAEQRSELLKIAKSGKLNTYRECRFIAKKMNLTVGQVLNVSRPYKDLLASKSEEVHTQGASPRKKRKFSQDDPGKHVHNDNGTSVSSVGEASAPAFEGNQMATNSLLPVDMDTHDNSVEDSKDDSDGNAEVDLNSKEVGENYAYISHCALSSLKSIPRKRFSWTNTLDSQLIMEYVRHRVLMGERFHRVDWSSVANLPALPKTCKRRIAVLRSDESIRISISKLCNLLADRYSRFLSNTTQRKTSTMDDDCTSKAALEGIYGQNPLDGESNSGSGVQLIWDDFNDPDIRFAFEEILRRKRMLRSTHAKMRDSSQINGSKDDPQSEGNILDDLEHVMPKDQFSVLPNTEESAEKHKRRRPNARYSHQKFLERLNSRTIKVRSKVCESLAVANAVELLKLVFLSNSQALQASLATTLRLYSETDLFVAFSYLKDKEFMIVGHGSQPFVLSSKFWQSASSSLFPVDSGKRATEFSNWLHKLDHDTEDAIELSLELQCGEIFHLFGLVSSEEVSISPCMPEEGTGEALNELNGSDSLPMDNLDGFGMQTSLKRKGDDTLQSKTEMTKKQRVKGKTEGEYCCRKEKGFPGIRVLINQGKIESADVVQHMINDANRTCSVVSEDVGEQSSYPDVQQTTSTPSLTSLNLFHNFGDNAESEAPPDKLSCWDSMSKFAANFLLKDHGSNIGTDLNPELFKSIHSEIKQAGKEGLTINEISTTVRNQGIQLAEVVINALEMFSLVYKVNAYDTVKVVDSSFRSKYFIKIVENPSQGDTHLSSANTGTQDVDENVMTNDEFNLSEHVSVKEKYMGKTACPAASVPPVYRPIVPWINSDGSANTIMFKGLTRRVLGTIMLNPGILEDDIIRHMDVLNPQSCRQLLATMALDNHIFTRMMYQTTSAAAPPPIFQSLFTDDISKPKSELRKHYFANPMSASLL